MSAFFDAFFARESRPGVPVSQQKSFGSRAGGALRNVALGLFGTSPLEVEARANEMEQITNQRRARDELARGNIDLAARLSPDIVAPAINVDTARFQLDAARAQQADEDYARTMMRRIKAAQGLPEEQRQAYIDAHIAPLLRPDDKALFDSGGIDAVASAYRNPTMWKAAGNAIFDPETGRVIALPTASGGGGGLTPYQAEMLALRRAELAHKWQQDANKQAAVDAEQQNAENEKRQQAEGFANTLASLAGTAIDLNALGAMVDPDQGSFQNLTGKVLGTDIGRGVAAVWPDRNIRNAAALAQAIEASGPALLAQIKNMGNLGAKMFDSNADRQFFMRLVPTPGRDLVANLAGLAVIDNIFGTSRLLDNLLASGKISPELYQQARARALPLMSQAPPLTQQAIQGGGLANMQPAGGAPTQVPMRAQSSSPQIKEGATAVNPQTGERIIFRNGQWQPM